MDHARRVNGDARIRRTPPVRTGARLAGALVLLSLVAGGFGEFYVPNRIVVSGNAAATARNVVALGALFRWGFAAYLVEAVCDIALTLLFYVLLRPVRRDLSLLAAFFGLVSTALFAVAEFSFFASSVIAGGADDLRSFSPDQRETLALLSIKLYGYGGGVFMVFYGVAMILRGYLIFRSGYLPRFLGVLLVIAGLGFVARNFTLVLAPGYASDLFLAPMFIASLALMAWLLVKGVDVAKWETKTGTSGLLSSEGAGG